MYQTVIVGGGIAGLHTGIEIAKRGISCCIIDEYKCGGRIQTYHNSNLGVQWENGAGRISTKHKMVLHYLKKYGLTFVPISSEINYLSKQGMTRNMFFILLSAFLKPLRSLSPEVLSTRTLQSILDEVIPNAKDFYTAFPYYAEIFVLRADVALDAFAGEMGSHHGFGICKEGLSTLVHHMMDEFLSLGGHIMEDTRVDTVESVNKLTFLHTRDRINGTRGGFSTPVCILAIPATALGKVLQIPAVTAVTRHLQSVPLLRIYMVFHNEWFHDLPSTVVDGPIRYIIPISKNVVMISYTEGPYTTRWMNMKDDDVQKEVLQEIRRLFPGRLIPPPIFFKMHRWREGCTYWLPGRYIVEEASLSILHPKRGIFVCGESYAIQQSWMESALEHANLLWSHPAFLQALQKAMELPIRTATRKNKNALVHSGYF